MKRRICLLLPIALLLCAFIFPPKKHVLYIIGDSTVRNTGKDQAGWGSFIESYFDSSRLVADNQAMAGRSTRTFIKEGRWQRVMDRLQPGNYVMMQFGHNEVSRPDTGKAGYRGVLRGTGPDTVNLVWPDGTPETVHTYGWYIRRMVQEAKGKGAIPIVVSMIPRNQWQNGKVKRADTDYGKWAAEIARQEAVPFIDLNRITADQYDQLGPDAVKQFFSGDHTHTNEAGARLNARSVVTGLQLQPACGLNQYLTNKTQP